MVQLKAMNDSSIRGRKPQQTVILINPEGEEVEVTQANANDLLTHVKGWKRANAVEMDSIVHPYARAPRKSRGSQPETTPQRNVITGETPKIPKDVTPNSVAAQQGQGRDVLAQAAMDARAAQERDTHGPTADDLEEEEFERAMSAPVQSPMTKLNIADENTRKERAAKRGKAEKGNDVEVVAKVTSNLQADLKKSFSDDDSLDE